MSKIHKIEPLGFPWVTQDPFLFCVHHLDHYPEGTEAMGPEPALLKGRRIGMDFDGKAGWSMYHGDVVPGFPQHPHRGFETVTIARQGFIDHSDSMGATARFGHGDVQWMTAGRGVVHSEMFPLVHRDKPNPTELFQIWLNLPREDKMVEPYFTMLWDHTIPVISFEDDDGHTTRVRVVAGRLSDTDAPAPSPNSWAARDESDIAIWTVEMEPGATWTVPAAQPDSNRTLYFFVGGTLEVEGQTIPVSRAVHVQADTELTLRNGPERAELLLLQGRPIGEPVAHHGPFVMNTPGELRQAFIDYQTTGFGGWPWDDFGPVHPRDRGKFARHADGREEEL